MNTKKTDAFLKKHGHALFTGVQPVHNVIKSGKGSFITDLDGNQILDLNAGQFCSIFGHSWSKLGTVIQNQLKEISHTGTNTVADTVYEAAERISNLCEGMSGKVMFLSTGAEAIECALRFAKGVKKRNGFLCFENGYHGLSLGAQSVTFGGSWALPQVTDIFSIASPRFHLLFKSETQIAIQNSLHELESILKKHHQTIAGFIMEPIISVGGMIYLPKEYCEGIYKLCKKYDVLLVYDECQTGIGRTGKWFCYQHTDVIPDILVSAKGIGAGFPVSFVVFNSTSVDMTTTPLNHFSSHQNDPISAAIATGVIDEIENRNLLSKVEASGKEILDMLTNLSNKYSFIRNPRGMGLMLGFDIFKPNLESYVELGKDFSQSLLENGVLLQSTQHGKTFRLLPNYLISKSEAKLFISTLEKVIKKFEKI